MDIVYEAVFPEWNVAPEFITTLPFNLLVKGEAVDVTTVVPEKTFTLALKLDPVLGSIVTAFRVLTVPEFTTVAPHKTANLPELNVKIKVFAENIPPVLISKKGPVPVGENVTLFNSVTFPVELI